ncbi:hypothetical protein SAMN04487997_1570 [Frateuria terrea]|uniref:Uncharacterized protein n=2 Tax=Frateuria terrea TaxID=529704 RepID=A0A1H6T402_9GAMM|nr:hypothetical protein SAMN04487997_1570 [Frateuria terrea]SFP28905.1 hypothetical protein SAMN02927913_1485 [Frateuria terrea]
MLVPPTRGALAMMLRLGCLAAMVSGLLLVRVLARQAILDAATAGRCRGG